MSLGDTPVLSLVLSMVQRNDCKLLTFIDESDWLNTLGIDPSAITSGDLTLSISIQTTSGSTVAYNAIDVYDEFGPFTTEADMVYPIDASMLIRTSDSVALGTSATVLPDGIYTIAYVYDNGVDDPISFSRYVLVDGIVANRVNALLRSIPTKYECGGPHEASVLNIVYANTYLLAMHASSVIVDVAYILKELGTLEDILDNGSLYTW